MSGNQLMRIVGELSKLKSLPRPMSEKELAKALEKQKSALAKAGR